MVSEVVVWEKQPTQVPRGLVGDCQRFHDSDSELETDPRPIREVLSGVDSCSDVPSDLLDAMERDLTMSASATKWVVANVCGRTFDPQHL